MSDGAAATWPLFCHGPRWFRIKGYGLRHVDHRRRPMSFSERNGYRRALHIGPHCLAVVRPAAPDMRKRPRRHLG